MAKVKNKENIIKRIIADKSLSANEIRVILYAMEEEVFTSRLLAKSFGWSSPQYVNRLIVSLEKKNYVKKRLKMEDSRTYVYRIIDEDILPGQTTIDDFE